jgi:hypothetical protein
VPWRWPSFRASGPSETGSGLDPARRSRPAPTTRKGATRTIGAALLLWACAAGSDPGSSPFPSVPLGRSDQPRAGRITYQLLSIEHDGSDVRVDLVLTNGTSRHFSQIEVRVSLLGPSGERRSQELPLGPLGRGRTKRFRARFSPVPFPVQEVLVDLTARIP